MYATAHASPASSSSSYARLPRPAATAADAGTTADHYDGDTAGQLPPRELSAKQVRELCRLCRKTANRAEHDSRSVQVRQIASILAMATPSLETFAPAYVRRSALRDWLDRVREDGADWRDERMLLPDAVAELRDWNDLLKIWARRRFPAGAAADGSSSPPLVRQHLQTRATATPFVRTADEVDEEEEDDDNSGTSSTIDIVRKLDSCSIIDRNRNSNGTAIDVGKKTKSMNSSTLQAVSSPTSSRTPLRPAKSQQQHIWLQSSPVSANSSPAIAVDHPAVNTPESRTMQVGPSSRTWRFDYMPGTPISPSRALSAAPAGTVSAGTVSAGIVRPKLVPASDSLASNAPAVYDSDEFEETSASCDSILSDRASTARTASTSSRLPPSSISFSYERGGVVVNASTVGKSHERNTNVGSANQENVMPSMPFSRTLSRRALHSQTNNMDSAEHGGCTDRSDLNRDWASLRRPLLRASSGTRQPLKPLSSNIQEQ